VLIVAGACTPVPSTVPEPTQAASAPAHTQQPTVSPTASEVVEPSPSPPVATAVDVMTQRIRGPLAPRIFATGVWTGSEAIMWGGWRWGLAAVHGPLGDGATYDPVADKWQLLPDAPIRGRARHIAVWTGQEMLIWGGLTGVRPRPPADGAAYNPRTGRWRTLAPSPRNFAIGAASVWADGEWVIALARGGTGDIEVIAYDPNRDRWRELPWLHGHLTEENQLVWTGSELLLINVADGLFRLAPDADAWTPGAAAPAPLWGQVVWTGDRLIGVAGNDNGVPLMAWEPASDSWSEMAQPGSLSPWTLVWTGDRVLFPNSGLAVNPSTSQWWNLIPAARFERSDAVLLWAGDRLLMLGGWHGGPGGPLPFGEAYIPKW
jgi:hypothetical protein